MGARSAKRLRDALTGLAATLMIAGVAGTASAQGQNCDSVLILQTSSQVTKTTYQLHWLSLIDEQSFNEMRRNADTGASFPVEGIPISGYGNFSSFDQARRRYLSQQNYSTSSSDARSALSIYLSDAQLNAWVDCKRQQTNGITAYIKNPAPGTLTVVIGWRPPPGVTSAANINLTVQGGQIAGRPPTRIPVNGQFTLAVNRTANSEFRLIVNDENGNTDQVYLPAAAPAVNPPPVDIAARRARASWVHLVPSNPSWQTIGTIDGNETKIFEAGGVFNCHFPRPGSCTAPVAGNLAVLYQPVGGQAQQISYNSLLYLTGPALVQARIVDSEYSDNADPAEPDRLPLAALY